MLTYRLIQYEHTIYITLKHGIGRFWICYYFLEISYYRDLMNNRKNDLILIMTPEKQDKTLELSRHWSVDSTPARNEVIMKRTYPVKSVKCDKISSNY